MKKLILLALLLPLGAFAADVNINSLSVSGRDITSSGIADYTGLVNTLNITLSNGNSLLSGTNISPWTAGATQLDFGSYVLIATVSEPDGSNPVSISRDFSIVGGGGQPICLREGTCPGFGLHGVFLTNYLAQNAPVVYERLKPGEGDCPAWFPPSGCVK